MRLPILAFTATLACASVANTDEDTADELTEPEAAELAPDAGLAELDRCGRQGMHAYPRSG